MKIDERIKTIRKNIGDEDWISPKTRIKRSKIGGSGLYALEPINKNELVAVWGGTFTDPKGAKKAKKNGKLVMQWDTDLFSVETPGEGSGYFINHSCDPNLWMYGPFALTSMKSIKKGEELTADYAIWEEDVNYISKWACNCGALNCRGKVTGKDWENFNLQKKYKNHFSPLLNKRIIQSK